MKDDTCNEDNFTLLSDDEVNFKLEKQIGQSACGPTAIKNVLIGLGFKIQDLLSNEELLEQLPARLRDYETEFLEDYLLSRTLAGTTQLDLIDGIFKISKGEVLGQLFTFDQRDEPKDFGKWLLRQMKNGCVPILTENLFLVGNDAWHHQMVYGLNEKQIFLTNYQEKENLETVFQWVTSLPFMIIPREHVLQRKLDLNRNQFFNQNPWNKFNVLEQIIQIKYSQKNSENQNFNEKQKINQQSFKGLVIPYGGISGVTLFIKKSNLKVLNEWENSKKKQIFLPLYQKNINTIEIKL